METVLLPTVEVSLDHAITTADTERTKENETEKKARLLEKVKVDPTCSHDSTVKHPSINSVNNRHKDNPRPCEKGRCDHNVKKKGNEQEE